jgi:hypothetical protein
VVSQIALSLTLLVGALLFGRSLGNLARQDAGFQRDGILVTDMDYASLNLTNEQRVAFGSELLKRVKAIPGTDGAAIVEYAPLSGNASFHDVLMGASSAPADEDKSSAFNIVSPGFFATLATPILAGRDFDEHDVAGAPLVAIVNETFARKMAKSENPVGMTFRVRAGQRHEVRGPARKTGGHRVHADCASGPS